MRGFTAVDMGKAVEEGQAAIAYSNANLDTNLRLAVGLAGPANRLVVVSGYPDLDALLAMRMRLGADAEMGSRMAAMATNFEAGSGTQYIIRHLHGSTESDTGNYAYFRGVQHKPRRMGEALPAALGIVDHLTENHGRAMSLGTPLGMASDTLLFVTRFQSANDVDAAFTALMGDDRYQELAADGLDLVQGIEDRFIMTLPT